jgi:membrane fusion protein, multidrug efflux system
MTIHNSTEVGNGKTPGMARMAQHPARAKTGWWKWLIFLVVVAAGVYVFLKYRASATASRPAPEAAANRSVPVVAVAARMADMPIYLDGLGNVAALNTVTIHTRVDGELQSIGFEEGQLVKEGQLLAEIDPRPYQAQLAQAEGQLAKDKAALKNAQAELERDKLAAEAIPKQQIDTQAATVDQFDAATKIDQGIIDNVNLQLTYCRIIAPISGRIGLRLVDKGNIVHANDPGGLAVITQLQPISVVFNISEDYIGAVVRNPSRGIGLAVDAYDRSFSSKLATGTLLAIDNQVDQTTGTIRLKATFPNLDNALFPNQFVIPKLKVDTVRNAVIIPGAAIQRGPDMTFVYVVKDDKVEVRNITLGQTEGDDTIITTGLAAGEIVVTDGVDKLQAGSKVSIRRPGTRPTTRTNQ